MGRAYTHYISTSAKVHAAGLSNGGFGFQTEVKKRIKPENVTQIILMKKNGLNVELSRP